MGEGGVASAAAVGPPPGMDVRLSSNESPYGPSPAVMDAIRDRSSSVHIYPDDQSVTLREALAKHELVDPDRVIVGTGSAGLLMDLILHEAGREDPGSVVTFERAFIVYKLGADVAEAPLIEVPVGGRYERDVDDLLAAVDDETRIVLVDNPGNPTGRHLDGDELRYLVDNVPGHVTIAIDEAYHHFASDLRGYATVGELGLEHPRLLVVRTFSKAYAMAGLRVGYLIGPPDLTAPLDAQRVRFNVNSVAQAAAVAALNDEAHLERTVTGTIDGRSRMADGLREIGVPVIEGLGNFVLVELGEPAAPVVEAYARHGVGVRPLAPYQLLQQIRVTVGTPDEVERFLEASRDVLADVSSRS